jgi:PAS domain S-box-containing protein
MIRRNFLPIFFALLTAAIILVVTFKLDRMEREYLSQRNHADALNQLSLVRAHLESALNSRLFLTRGLVAFVTNQPEVKGGEFRSFAGELVKQQPGIRSIQLAQNSVVSHIYPLPGNEKALGLKLLELATSKDAAQRAINSHQTVVNGPFELVQGGKAIVSRTPVYLKDKRYWGLASILINPDVLFEEAGLNREHPTLKFALRGKDGLGAAGEVFWGDEKIFTPDSVRLDITLPGGSWQIAATHKEGWDTPGTMWLRYGGILLALVAGTLAWFITRNPAKLREEVGRATRALSDARENLESEVRTRTYELEIANRHLLSEITIRHHTEQSLREQRDLYQALLKAQSDIGEGLFIVEDRRIVYANEAICRITGYAQEEIRALPSFTELVHPDLREATMANHLRRIAGEQFENRYEIILLTKTGEPREGEIAISTMPGSNGLAVVVVVQDISRRKQMENELKGRVRFIQTLIDAIPNPIFFKDIGGRYLGCNKAFENSLGLPSSEVIGKTVHDFNPRELADIYQRMDNALFDNTELQIYESKVLFADGLRHDILFYKSVFTDASNNVAGLVGVMLDITTRKATEEALVQARDELELRVAERTRELAQANQELNAEIAERRRLETEIIHVSENEQKRIGQELHDGLGQHLTGIAFLSKALERKLAALSLAEKFDAAEIVQLVNRSVSVTRALARGLFPVELEANGLMAALEQLAVNMETLYDVTCAFLCDEPVLVYDNVVATSLYRIAQEAAGNAIKHGRATHISIELTNFAGKVLLTVSDDGIGFDPAVRESNGGMGIHIMQYRAKMIGAILEVRGSGQQGTTISISVANREQ